MGDQADDKHIYCSFCRKNEQQVRRLIAGPEVFICDECIDLCNEIIAEAVEVDEVTSQEGAVELGNGVFVTPPQIVTRFTNAKIDFAPPGELVGVYWICEGCGWRIKLASGAQLPSEHSELILLGTWPGPPGDLPSRQSVPNCPEPSWRRLA